MRRRRKTEKLLHPEVQQFVRREAKRLGTDDPEKLVTLFCRDLVHKAIDGRLESCPIPWGPPFDVTMLASMLGHAVHERRELISDDAELHPDPDNPGRRIIYYNPDRPSTRSNFSIAHELGHTIFCPDSRVCFRHRPQDKANQQLESLCDMAAAEFLMPHDPFLQDLGNFGGVSLSTLAKLATRYLASREAIANRMAKLSPLSWASVLFSKKLKPTEEWESDQGFLFEEARPQEKLRIDYCVHSSSFPRPFYLPPNKSIPDESPLYGVYEFEVDYNGEIFVPVGRHALCFSAEAMFLYGGSGPDRVLAFLAPVRRESI